MYQHQILSIYTAATQVHKLMYENICVSKGEKAICFFSDFCKYFSYIFFHLFLFCYSICVFCTMPITTAYQYIEY